MTEKNDHFQPLESPCIGIIGLGYVGLPLAVEFASLYETIGFDIRADRIAELNDGRDSTREVEPEKLAGAKRLSFTHEEAELERCNVLIVTVPTPVDVHKVPDLSSLRAASKTAGRRISSPSVVIFESTVYPGATEEVCVPLIEQASGLTFNRDFFVGYSPERVNPGDKTHRLRDIIKVTSGSTPAAADFVDALYAGIVTVGTHKVSSIRVAEAAKVIENTQRDVNIALINEFAMLFNRLEIDTLEVLEAAGTKWNFLSFRPGLVGGHCIGVDPYYLTHKSQAIGHHPEMILAGRRINDAMGTYIVDTTVKTMLKKGINIVGSRILVLGLTFKENCPDLRNTRVVDIIAGLKNYNAQVDIWDPWVELEEAKAEYGIEPLAGSPGSGKYEAIILAVPHYQFVDMGFAKIAALGKPGCVIVDVKSVLPRNSKTIRL